VVALEWHPNRVKEEVASFRCLARCQPDVVTDATREAEVGGCGMGPDWAQSIKPYMKNN
jgi:hypothetical protein